MAERPVALVTAPFRGEGMDTLGTVADIVYDPWLEQRPLRIYNAEDLAERIDKEGAEILIVERRWRGSPTRSSTPPAKPASARPTSNTPPTGWSRWPKPPSPRPA